MRILYERGCYNAYDVSDRDAEQLLNTGWKFARGTYRTSRAAHVIPHRDFCGTQETLDRVEKALGTRLWEVAASVALDADIIVPAPPGLSYRPYQRAGIAYALPRQRCLIADSPRLGKTIQAIGVANATPKFKRHLIICPATVKINWKREYQKWDTHGLTVGVVDSDSYPDTDVVIINYDLAERHVERLLNTDWDQITVDEAHYLKSADAKRTRAILGDIPHDKKGRGPLPTRRWLFLTGTPLYTRPRDLWTLCHMCDPTGLGRSRFKFMTRYADAGWDEGGRWHEDGAANLEELQRLMRKAFMVRREKRDVAADIPPNRSTIVLPSDGLGKLLASERSLMEQRLDQIDEMMLAHELAHAEQDANDDMDQPIILSDEAISLASVRKELALRKLPMIIPMLEEIEGKIVVFAHHRDVLKRLKDHFGDSAVLVWGGMAAQQKQDAVDAFTNNPDVKVFLGNIVAAGQGITLAVADTVAFVELTWVPSELLQSEERVWLPEKTEPVEIIRYVVENSIDEAMVYVLDARLEDMAKATMAERIGVKALVS